VVDQCGEDPVPRMSSRRSCVYFVADVESGFWETDDNDVAAESRVVVMLNYLSGWHLQLRSFVGLDVQQTRTRPPTSTRYLEVLEVPNNRQAS